MKQLTLVRFFQDAKATLGALKLEGIRHDPIFTLENPLRETPVDSLIPAGTYICRPYTSQRWPNTFEVMNVPGRTAILFHYGNFESDTLGCILVGLGAGIMQSQPAVMNSKAAMNLLRELVGGSEFELQIGDLKSMEVAS